MLKNNLYKHRGVTLVEILLAFAIFGILSVVLLNIFSSGYAIIRLQGHKATALYKAQQNVEAMLSVDNVGTGSLNIEVPNVGILNIQGKYDTVSVDYKGRTLDQTIFIPNK